MKYGLRGLAGSVASVGLLAACNGPSLPETETQAAQAQPQVEVSANAYQQLMAIDAPLHIVHIPANPDTADAQDAELQAAKLSGVTFWGEFSPETARSVTDFAAQATGGRYTPDRVTVADAVPLSESVTCVENDSDSQVTAIQKHIRPYLVADTVNIAIIDLPNCSNDFIAYGGDGIVPILTAESYASFNSTAFHEIGHSGGLEHAGTLDCVNEITITDCVSDPTGDRGSVMSYTLLETSNDYTFADLMQLNLLKTSEITVPAASGDYEVTDPTILDDQSSPKGLVLPTEAGTLYVSWEEDDEATYDQVCLEELLEVESQTIDSAAIEGTVLCGTEVVRESTRSLQVRLRGEDDHIGLVLRPGATVNDGLSHPQTRSGEVVPGTVVYEDAVFTISYAGQKSDETAVVHVDARI